MMIMEDMTERLLKSPCPCLSPTPIRSTTPTVITAGAGDNDGSEGEDEDRDGTSELIANLDHDIPEIRVRALKCLHRKLDLGLVYGTRLSKRIDLLQRLTSWLRSSKWTEEELLLIIQFLSQMCQREEFRKNFMNTPLDSLLGKARRLVKGDTRHQIDKLMDSVQSFDIYCEGPAEDWQDNSSIPLKSQSVQHLSRSASALVSPRSKLGTAASSATSIKVLKPPAQNALMDNSDESKDDRGEEIPDFTPEPATDVFYFANSSKPMDEPWIKSVEFGIPPIRLETSDRRVMSSTVESFLSKNEGLIMITTCFMRDVLLNDFPPETFVQESSLCMSLLQVIEEPWEDKRINYAGFQALYKLSSFLQTKLGYLDCSEFYQNSQRNSDTSRSNSHRSNSSYPPMMLSPLAVSTENFLTSLLQLLKGLSRALTFKPKNIYLWILIDSYSSTLHRYMQVFQGNPKAMYIHLEEVLLDLSQCSLRNPDEVSPCHLAIVFTSLLACFQDKENLMLTKDVRRTMWSLGSNAKLGRNSSSFILRHFLLQALPFEPGLDKAREMQPNEFTVENYHSWWKMDVVNGQRARGNSVEDPRETPDPEVAIPSILIAIQNAIEHRQVVEGIEGLWDHLLPLVLNRRTDEKGIDDLINPAKSQWREAFYRYLSVEPTSSEDEDLLVRVLDLISFLLKSLKNSEVLRKWVVPLVTEKGSAVMRILVQHCVVKGAGSAPGGTNVPTIIRSVFDFYHVILLEGSSGDHLGELLNTYALMLKVLKQNGFTMPAVLHSVLYGLANLTSEDLIIIKLQEDPEQTISLMEYVSAAVQALGERISDGSYRNRGAIQQATVLLLHLCLVTSKQSIQSLEWIAYCIPILPFLWIVENSTVRAAALQISCLITSTPKGTLLFLSELESPTLLWSYAYTRLNDPEETSIVRHKAGTVLLNLIIGWNEMKKLTEGDLEVPKVRFMEDLLKLLQQVYWHSKLSVEMRSTEDQENRYTPDGSGDASDSVILITPKVLSVISNLISVLVTGDPIESKVNFQNNELLFREVLITLSRTIGKHKLTNNMDEIWWIECCGALANTIQALISLAQLDRSLSLILISDRLNLVAAIRLFNLVPVEGKFKDTSTATLTDLWKNIFTLLITLCVDSGYNFEDLERGIWTQRNVIFPRLTEWLDTKTAAKHRRSAFDFLNTFLSLSLEKHAEDKRQLFLCQVWKEPGVTYGVSICDKVVGLLDEALSVEERVSLLQCMNCLYQLSPSAKIYALQNNVIKKLLRGLRDFGIKSLDSNTIQPNRKNAKDQEHIKWIITVLSTLFHNSSEARDLGMAKHFADLIHTIIKFTNYLLNRSLLHSSLDCLINFTDEFPQGSHSLILTSGMTGVPSRKIASPNSLYMEILGLLQAELDAIEKTPNLKTLDLLMSLLNNTLFSAECRNILPKVKILIFIRRLHATEIKKWGYKYPQVKQSFLQFLVQLTFHSDMQAYIAKIHESIEVFILLSENETLPFSLLALQILRNISAYSGNRARLLHDARFMSGLADRLKTSESLEELECVGVTLWAVTANCEKGKLAAKRMGCTQSLNSAIQRLRRKELSSTSAPRDETPKKCSLHTVIELLEKVSSIQRSSSTGNGGAADELDTYRDI